MTTTPLAAVVMAAGLGTRMRSATQKHLHPLLGRRMVDWVLDAVRPLQPQRLVLVSSPESTSAFDGIDVAVQAEPLGTGDAVATARGSLDGFEGDVLVVSGDSPLLTVEVLQELVEEHRRGGAAATVLTFEPGRALPYGHVLRNENGGVAAIVEDAEATPEQRAVGELSTSTYVFSVPALWDALERLRPENTKGELYLTDAIEELVREGHSVAAHRTDDRAAPLGVNTRAELAAAAAVLRDRVNEEHMLAGVTIVDPSTTWIEAGVELAPEAVLHPFTILRGDTRIGAHAEIGPHVVAADAEIGEHCVVGPFCYLRPGTVLAERVKAGAFVEIKNSKIGEGTKVPHLSYLGDAEVGELTNIGAGGITVNYPHEPDRPKGRTKIGKNVRTGVQNAFVAPVEIGDDAWIAAGSVITDDVPPGSLAGFPPRQVTKEGYVHRKRKRDDD